jgi:hypothetical protein
VHPSLGALTIGLGSYRLSDPFLLSINGGAALNPSAISNPLYADHQFSFPPPAQVPAPSNANSLDYSAWRYRAQADSLTRTGVIPQERAPLLPAIYQESQVPHDPSNAARYAQSYRMHDDPQDYLLFPARRLTCNLQVRVIPEQRPRSSRQWVQPSSSVAIRP